MNTSVLPFGTQIASEVLDASVNDTPEVIDLETVGDLLDRLATNPPRSFRMVRTTCSLLGIYLDKPVGDIPIDSVIETRGGFRTFLETRKYAENSIRTYVNHVRILLKAARDLGWKPNEEVPEEWQGVLALAAEKKCADVVKYLAVIKRTPRDVREEDVDRWVQMKLQQGLSYEWIRGKETWFWRLLRDCGCTEQTPLSILREKDYGVPFDHLPPALKKELLELLRWKRAKYSVGRPKHGRHREVTSEKLRHIICAVFGFALNLLGESGISSLPQLAQERIIGGYIEWCINERQVKGRTLQRDLRLFSAAVNQHPSYKSMDLTWFRPLLDGIPIESESELKKRKATKYLEYEVLESIAPRIRAEMPVAMKKGINRVALLVMMAFLMKWLTTLPWRQRNIRECRIGGPTPNLFKGRIPPFSDIDKPDWVKQEEQENPGAEFWQFKFSEDETKTGKAVSALLPRQLIGLLEEYLQEYRPFLIRKTDPETLFVNRAGNAMTRNQMVRTVAGLTLRYGGTRVTPHPFRDIVAFTWLKAHPADYLTLSKMLWHTNINTTIQIYGSRFNESSGVCAMEGWLDEREAKSK